MFERFWRGPGDRGAPRFWAGPVDRRGDRRSPPGSRHGRGLYLLDRASGAPGRVDPPTGRRILTLLLLRADCLGQSLRPWAVMKNTSRSAADSGASGARPRRGARADQPHPAVDARRRRRVDGRVRRARLGAAARESRSARRRASRAQPRAGHRQARPPARRSCPRRPAPPSSASGRRTRRHRRPRPTRARRVPLRRVRPPSRPRRSRRPRRRRPAGAAPSSRAAPEHSRRRPR